VKSTDRIIEPSALSTMLRRRQLCLAATLAVAGLWSRLFPELSRMDRFPGAES